jgi:hypothetical protein
MNLRHVASCGLVCAALVLTGCDQGVEDPGDATVRVANVAPGFTDLGFRREHRGDPQAFAFKNAQEFTYDVDTYDFYVFERSLVTNVAGRSWTFSQQLQANHGYSFILTQIGTEVQPVVLEYPTAPAADAQIVALHAAAGLPAMDLYLVPPGVGIAGATPRGTFNVQEQIAPHTLAGGEYELWLTAAGNPANVLLATGTITLNAGATTTLVVTPEPGVGGAPLSVLLLGASPAVLYDRNAGAELRVINAAVDCTPRDVAVAGQFSPPLFSAVPFGQPTAYAPIPAATQAINVTPVGNPGVLELDQQISPNVAERLTVLFGGPAGTLLWTLARDDGRRIPNEAKLNFMNAATQFLLVDYLITTPGGDPMGLAAVATLGAPSTTVNYNSFPPGDYDLYTRQSDTGALLSGPTPISLAGGGIYSVLTLNGLDTATTRVELFDDFP